MEVTVDLTVSFAGSAGRQNVGFGTQERFFGFRQETSTAFQLFSVELDVKKNIL